MKDLFLPSEMSIWQKIEETARHVCVNAGFGEVRTPLLEPTALYLQQRGLGVDTDVVSKELYTFQDRNGDSLTLRPEGTASIVRAALQNGWLNTASMKKVFYMGPMYRHERPQKGRYREFRQLGVELLGAGSPEADVEVIALGHFFLKSLGLPSSLQISTLGSVQVQQSYRMKLRTLLEKNKENVPPDFLPRIATNPQRIFDHKAAPESLLRQLPTVFDFLDAKSQEHFNAVQNGLNRLGVGFEVNPYIVRGLDYYGHTAFEWVVLGGKGSPPWNEPECYRGWWAIRWTF